MKQKRTYFPPTTAQQRIEVWEETGSVEGFLHVVVARHRSQSNGIVERFVRTLKEWFAKRSWNHDQESDQLLTEF